MSKGKSRDVREVSLPEEVVLLGFCSWVTLKQLCFFLVFAETSFGSALGLDDRCSFAAWIHGFLVIGHWRSGVILWVPRVASGEVAEALA